MIAFYLQQLCSVATAGLAPSYLGRVASDDAYLVP